MRLVWAVTCRYVEPTGDGTAVIVGAGIDAATVPDLPFELALNIVVKLSAQPDEENTEHELVFKLQDPLMNDRGEMRGPLHVGPRNPSLPQGLDESIVLPTTHVFVVERAGLHQLDLYIDDRLCGSIPFHIALREPEAEPPAE